MILSNKVFSMEVCTECKLALAKYSAAYRNIHSAALPNSLQKANSVFVLSKIMIRQVTVDYNVSL